MLAVFTRRPLDEDAFAWLRVFADQAAVAIAHSHSGGAPSAHAPDDILSAAEMKRQDHKNIAAALRRTQGENLWGGRTAPLDCWG
jgi:hypothetical protein